jgi:hypothetical protein
MITFILNVECFRSLNFYQKYYFKVFFPIAMSLSCLVLSKCWNNNEISRAHMISRVLVFYSPTILFTLFSPFKCVRQPDGTLTSWADPSLDCNDESRKSFQVLNAVLLLMYLPANIYLQNLDWSPKMCFAMIKQKSNSKILDASFSSWKVLSFAELLTVVCILNFFPLVDGTPGNYVILIFFSVLFLVLDMLSIPYENQTSTKISIMWRTVFLFSVFVDGLIFKNTEASSTFTPFSIFLIAMWILSLAVTMNVVFKGLHRNTRYQTISLRTSHATLSVLNQMDFKFDLDSNNLAETIENLKLASKMIVECKGKMDYGTAMDKIRPPAQVNIETLSTSGAGEIVPVSVSVVQRQSSPP